jgi:hypothetical protein
MPDNRQVRFNVVFEEARTGAVPLFSNHVGISRAGTEVQFECAFLDINVVATILRSSKKEHSDPSPIDINGKSVAKIVMPLHAFLQLKEHLQGMFADIEKELRIAQQEEGNESSSSVSNVQVV